MTEARVLTDEEKALVLELRASRVAWDTIAARLNIYPGCIRRQVDPEFVARMQSTETRRRRRESRASAPKQYTGFTYTLTERWEDRAKPVPPQVHVDVAEVKRLHAKGMKFTELMYKFRPVPRAVLEEILGPVQ